jgi:hypothetical protein
MWALPSLRAWRVSDASAPVPEPVAVSVQPVHAADVGEWNGIHHIGYDRAADRANDDVLKDFFFTVGARRDGDDVMIGIGIPFMLSVVAVGVLIAVLLWK